MDTGMRPRPGTPGDGAHGTAAGRAGPRLRRAAAILVALLLLCHAAIAWAPFELDVPARVDNGASRQTDGALDSSGRRAVAVADAPTALREASIDDAVELRVRARPAEDGQEGPARILTYSGGTGSTNVTIGQAGSDLVVRVRRPGSDALGRPPLTVRNALRAGEPATASVTVRGAAVTLSVAGHEPVTVNAAAPVLGAWDPGHRIAVGDEVGGHRVWHGTVEDAQLTVGSGRVDLLEPRLLHTPTRIWYVPTERWRDSLLPDSAARGRSILHALAFVPLGALLPIAWHRLAHPGRLLGATLAVSLALQAGKLLVAGRHPSWLDVLAHLLGVLLGALALDAARARRPGR